MIRIFTRQIEKLHEEEGQALVFVALVGLVIFLFLAMAMNVAEMVNLKIKNQNVADAAALSAAVWQARTLNLVSGINRNMLELYAAALLAWQACGIGVLGCELAVCGEVWTDPLFCLGCLLAAGVACEGAIAATLAAASTGIFQEAILSAVDKAIIEEDLPQVIEQNYAFKPNTRNLDVENNLEAGFYVHYGTAGEQLLQAYTPGQAETNDYVLERVGFCPTFVMVARYGNYWWHASEEDFGLSDDQWDTFADTTLRDLFTDGGACYRELGILPGVEIGFPLGLRTRDASWAPNDLDPLLAVTVATFRQQEPPTVLGKGSGPADCTWEDGDMKFVCPDHRHYAFATAHAYSEAASSFYNANAVTLASAHEIPYISFEMDWEARLFPVSRDGYYDIAIQIENDGFAADAAMLFGNVLDLGGADYFLF